MWKNSGILISHDRVMDDLYNPGESECHIIIRCPTVPEVEKLRTRLLDCLNSKEWKYERYSRS